MPDNISTVIDMSIKKYNHFDQNTKYTSKVFDALSEANRLKVYAILSYGETTVSSIYKCLTLPQNLISHHLKVLKNRGLVIATRRGREIYYSINSKTLRTFRNSLEKVVKPLAI